MRKAAVIAAAFLVSSCGAGQQEAVVFAASSLNGVGEELEEAFELANPGTEITMSYAGSAELVRHLAAGAPADVLITADEISAEQSGLDARPVATGRLVLALAHGNPAGLTDPRDLGSARLALCAPEVPCGRLTRQFLEGPAAGQEPALEPSMESSVTDVATKVTTGAVDAGFIYEANAKALGLTYLPLDGVAANVYPAALTSRGADNDAAQAFYHWLTGPEAQEIFTRHGFETVGGGE